MPESGCKRIHCYALRAIAPSMTEPPEYRHVHMTDFADLAGQAYFSHCFNFRPHRVTAPCDVELKTNLSPVSLCPICFDKSVDFW